MTENKEHKKSLLELAAIISPIVQIENIRLSDAEIRLHQVECTDEAKVHFRFGATNAIKRNENKLTVHAVFQVQAVEDRPENPNAVVFSIAAEFTLEYSLKTFEGIESENIDAFAESNGIYNAWPYWREFVQSMTTRMGLPALTLTVITGNYLEQYYKRFDTMTDDSKSAGPSDAR